MKNTLFYISGIMFLLTILSCNLIMLSEDEFNEKYGITDNTDGDEEIDKNIYIRGTFTTGKLWEATDKEKMTETEKGIWAIEYPIDISYVIPSWMEDLSNDCNIAFKFTTGIEWGVDDGLDDWGAEYENKIFDLDVENDVFNSPEDVLYGAQNIYMSIDLGYFYNFQLDTNNKTLLVTKGMNIE